jgi:hypothetical protein
MSQLLVVVVGAAGLRRLRSAEGAQRGVRALALGAVHRLLLMGGGLGLLGRFLRVAVALEARLDGEVVHRREVEGLGAAQALGAQLDQRAGDGGDEGPGAAVEHVRAGQARDGAGAGGHCQATSATG